MEPLRLPKLAVCKDMAIRQSDVTPSDQLFAGQLLKKSWSDTIGDKQGALRRQHPFESLVLTLASATDTLLGVPLFSKESRGRCRRTCMSWDYRLLEQLPDGIRARFPCILKHNFARERTSISFPRVGTDCDSPTILQHKPSGDPQ